MYYFWVTLGVLAGDAGMPILRQTTGFVITYVSNAGDYAAYSIALFPWPSLWMRLAYHDTSSNDLSEFAGVFLCSTIIFMLGWFVFIKKPHTKVRYRCSCSRTARKVSTIMAIVLLKHVMGVRTPTEIHPKLCIADDRIR